MTRPFNMAVTVPCVVCEAPVQIQPLWEGDPLCIEHFFTEDPTEEWERDDDQG